MSEGVVAYYSVLDVHAVMGNADSYSQCTRLGSQWGAEGHIIHVSTYFKELGVLTRM